jgi:hypothetical protein
MKELCDNPIYEFRPLKEGKYLRYADGKWIEDDGEYDLAFVGISDTCMAWYFRHSNRPNILWSWCKGSRWQAKVENHPNGNAWHYMLKEGKTGWGDCWNKQGHPNEIAGNSAMNKCCELYSCANGRGPEMYILNPYIKAGLVRERDTKKILTFPEKFNCMYCGEIDWRKEESI